MAQKIFDKDFKLEAVYLVVKQKRPVTAIAKEIGIQENTLYKWIRQHLHIKHFFGTGEQVVETQLYIALISYCLLTLIKQKTGYAGTLLELKRCLCTSLYEPFP